MACPWFAVKTLGVCTSSTFPYIPSLTELERFCFTDDFSDCPFHIGASMREARDKRVQSAFEGLMRRGGASRCEAGG